MSRVLAYGEGIGLGLMLGAFIGGLDGETFYLATILVGGLIALMTGYLDYKLRKS